MPDNELKKLNKTVDEAVNMLKIYMGSSANYKQMSEKQREAIDKWFDVADTLEKKEKQQRAFTERERDASGKFVKKMDSTFMGMASSISGIFMGMAKGIGSTIGGMAKGITSHLKNFFGAVKSHFLSLFGEESEWFDILGSIKDSVVGFFGWFVRGFLWVFKKTPAWANKMIGIMSSMYALQIKQMKMEFLTDDNKKKMTLGSILGGILFLGAALIGGWIRKKLMGIELILRSFKIGNIWKRFKGWIKGIPGRLRARFTWIDDIAKSKAFQWLKRGFIKIGGWMKDFGKWLLKAPILGKLLRGLKFGFKILGWPITILFGIIDFIKGWMNTEGNWQDKLTGGLKTAFHGLLDLPLDILGWAFDKVMGWFGVDSTGSGEKLQKWFDDFMGFIFEWGPIGIISDIIAGFTSEGGFAEAFGPKIEKIKKLMTSLLDVFVGIWEGLLNWVDQTANKYLGETIGGWVSSFIGSDEPTKKTPAIKKDLPKLVAAHEATKIEMANNNSKKIQDAVEEGTLATTKHTRKTGDAVTALTNIARTGNQQTIVDQKQIPDELDNYIMNVKNYGGDFD